MRLRDILMALGLSHLKDTGEMTDLDEFILLTSDDFDDESDEEEE